MNEGKGILGEDSHPPKYECRRAGEGLVPAGSSEGGWWPPELMSGMTDGPKTMLVDTLWEERKGN